MLVIENIGNNAKVIIVKSRKEAKVLLPLCHQIIKGGYRGYYSWEMPWGTEELIVQGGNVSRWGYLRTEKEGDTQLVLFAPNATSIKTLQKGKKKYFELKGA